MGCDHIFSAPWETVPPPVAEQKGKGDPQIHVGRAPGQEESLGKGQRGKDAATLTWSAPKGVRLALMELTPSATSRSPV